MKLVLFKSDYAVAVYGVKLSAPGNYCIIALGPRSFRPAGMDYYNEVKETIILHSAYQANKEIK